MYKNPEVDFDRERSYHETRIDSGTNISTKRIPTFGVKEIPKLPEVMIDQEFSSPIIKPRIKLVDDRFITDNTEDTDDSRD